MIKGARKKYIGCIAIRVNPNIYSECLEEYSNPEEKYEKYSIVLFNALRDKEYERELDLGNKQRVLKLPEKAKISYLSIGIQQYIDTHPERFNYYLQEVKAEGKYLEAICKAWCCEPDLNSRQRIQGQIMDLLENETEY